MGTGASLKDQMSQKTQEIRQAVTGLSEDKAEKEPAEGEWCAKEVLSHLGGRDSLDILARAKRFIEEDTPVLDIPRGVSFYETRRNMSLADLTAIVDSTYAQIGTFLGGLTDEQLNRKAQIPLFKETPIGEYPTLAQWASFVINFHINAHIQQLRALAQQ
jgi:uncharacterized damage-inducible protein DinB